LSPNQVLASKFLAMEQLIRITHIATGSLALFTGALIIFKTKGDNWHRKAGQLYFWAMTLVFITSLFLAVQEANRFLFLIGFISYYSVFAGLRFTRLKELHQQQKPKWYDWFAGLLNALANLVFLVMGLYYVTQQESIQSFAFLSIGFGLGGLSLSYINLKPFVKRPKESYHWYLAHIGNMMGAYIATFTAFLSTSAARWDFLEPFWAFLLPSALGVPLLIFWQRKIERRFKV
jgi:uncharacterized membrane protein